MNYKEKQKIEMFIDVKSNFQDNSDLYHSLVNYDSYYISFINLTEELFQYTKLQQYSRKGYAENKRILRLNLLNLTIDYCNKLKAYAIFFENEMLIVEINSILKLLDKVGANTFVDRCNAIYSRIEFNLKFVNNYGLNLDTQTIFKNAIDAYNEAIPLPQIARNDSVQNKIKIDSLIKQIMGVLYKIDSVIDLIQFSHPYIHQLYRITRKQRKPSHRKISLRIRIVDKNSNEGLMGVHVTCTLDRSSINYKEDVKPIVKISSKKGGLIIPSMYEGIYIVKAVKDGFLDYETHTIVYNGERTKLEIKMDQINMTINTSASVDVLDVNK